MCHITVGYMLRCTGVYNIIRSLSPWAHHTVITAYRHTPERGMTVILHLRSACVSRCQPEDADSSTSSGVSCRDVGMSWPLSAAARASVGLSRGNADTERAAGAGAGAVVA